MRTVLVAATVAALVLGTACGRTATPRGPAPASRVDPKWAEHVGDIPFVEGKTAGASAVAASGLPAMYFFTSPT